jgi:chromate reductase
MARILGLSSSLRARSLNSMLLRVAARIAAPSIEFELYGEIGSLPMFNTDLEAAYGDSRTGRD